jgi:5-methyltetrahydropteroyltriglutamate--homocysteine methyltransferase
MGQQAKNEFYKDDERWRWTSPSPSTRKRWSWKRRARRAPARRALAAQRPGAAKRYAVKAINRALQGSRSHGRAPVLRLRGGGAGRFETDRLFVPAGLADSIAEQISIEAAQPKLDLGVLRDLAGKKVMLGVLDLGTDEIETPQSSPSEFAQG